MAADWVLSYAAEHTILVERKYHPVKGCGNEDLILEYCIAGVGCKYGSVNELLKHASFDMGCEESGLEAVRIDYTTMGISPLSG